MTLIVFTPDQKILDEFIKDYNLQLTAGYHIVVYKDPVNFLTPFSYVINTFRKVLMHTVIQAEQCAIIINDAGKCSVKNGTIDRLIPMNDLLKEAKLDSVIEKRGTWPDNL